MLFSKKQLVDERVYNMQNKIYREMYHVIMLICCISIVLKFINKGFSFNNVLLECVILFVGGVYYTLRSAQLGVFSDEVEMHDATSKINYRKKMIIYGIALGCFIALAMGTNSAVNYADTNAQALVYFFSVALISLFIYAPFFSLALFLSYYTTKKKSDKVNKKNLEDPDEW